MQKPLLRLAVVVPECTTGTRELVEGVADFAIANPSSKVLLLECSSSETSDIAVGEVDGVISAIPGAEQDLKLDQTTVHWSLFSNFKHGHAEGLLAGFRKTVESRSLAFATDSGDWGSGAVFSTLTAAAGSCPYVFNSDLSEHNKVLARREVEPDVRHWLTRFKDSAIVCSDSKVAQRVQNSMADGSDLPVMCLHDDSEAILNGITAVKFPFSQIASHALASVQYRLRGDTKVPRMGFSWRIVQRSSTRNNDVDIAQLAYDLIQRRVYQGIRCCEIVKQLRVSPRTLNRRFQSRYGITPGRFIRNLRLENARALLSQTDKRIVDVARECGFSDASKFCVFYKRETGLTATEYRDHARS